MKKKMTKELITGKKTPFLWMALIIVLALFLRLYKLGQVPMSLTNDELVYIYTGYSIFKTGRDILGDFLPWITHLAIPFSSVYPYLVAPFVGILGLTPFWGRFPNVLLGVAQIVLFYLIIKKIFKSDKLALVTSFVIAVSTWHLQLTRSAYDVVSAIFFYLLSIYLFLCVMEENNNGKRNYLYFSISAVSFFLAIFAYRATALIFFPILFSLLLYSWGNLKTKTKPLLFFALLISIVVGATILINNHQGPDFTKEAFRSLNSPFNREEAQKIVDHEIANAQAPLIISRIFDNKITYGMHIFRENYLGAFSMEYLFTKGEAMPIYNLWWRGMLYLIELPLILLGFCYLYQLNKKGFYFIILSLLMAPLPSAVAGPTYVSRAFYMIFPLATLTASGILYLKEKAEKIKLGKIALALIVFLYFIQLTSYLYQYYARYSIYGAESWFKSTQDLSRYMGRHPQNNIIVANGTVFELVNYAFYQKINPVKIQKAYAARKIDTLSFENINFINNCLNQSEGNPRKFLPPNTIYITRFSCHIQFPADINLRRYNGKFTKESEIIWKIYKSSDLK